MQADDARQEKSVASRDGVTLKYGTMFIASLLVVIFSGWSIVTSYKNSISSSSDLQLVSYQSATVAKTPPPRYIKKNIKGI